MAVDPQSKEIVYTRVHESAQLGNLNYWLELLLSAGIATLGLVLNSPAVVIGAMLISPLMGPIIGAGVALAAADLYLGLKALLIIIMSLVSAVGFSAAVVWMLPFRSVTGEIVARTQPNLLDLAVALFSGLSGSMVVLRGGGGGGVTALPGVAIAVALMPPLCTVGFGVGGGMLPKIISGALLLFMTNLAAIVASAFVVFSIVRMDSPDIRARIDRAVLDSASQDRLYRLLRNTRLARSFGDVGKLRWRVLMLLGVLALLFVPLRQGLIQVRDETIARGAVREAIRSLVPADALVLQHADISSDRIAVRLVVTSKVNKEKVREAERALIRRTGKEATVSVRRVAGDEELALLREQLRTPVPVPPPAPPTVEAVRREVVPRLEAALKEVWPAEVAPLLAYELGFTATETVVRIRYRAVEPVDAAVAGVLTKLLRARLDSDELTVALENEPPPPEPRKKTGRAKRTQPRSAH